MDNTNRRKFLTRGAGVAAAATAAAAMNEVHRGAFGPGPPVRTTIAAAGGIPGNSLHVIASL